MLEIVGVIAFLVESQSLPDSSYHYAWRFRLWTTVYVGTSLIATVVSTGMQDSGPLCMTPSLSKLFIRFHALETSRHMQKQR